MPCLKIVSACFVLEIFKASSFWKWATIVHLPIDATIQNWNTIFSSRAVSIIHRPGVKLDKLSVPLPTLGLTRKTTTKILGVTITDTLSFSPHITDVIARCSQTSYALRILRAHGLNGPALWNVTRSTLISKLLYASPVWFGYLDKESRDQCQSLLNRLKRWGFLGKDFDNFITLCENADDVLFSALLLNEKHWPCFTSQLLPPVKCTQYNLRNRPHNYTLPKVNNNCIKNNFMFRMLYKNIY